MQTEYCKVKQSGRRAGKRATRTSCLIELHPSQSPPLCRSSQRNRNSWKLIKFLARYQRDTGATRYVHIAVTLIVFSQTALSAPHIAKDPGYLTINDSLIINRKVYIESRTAHTYTRMQHPLAFCVAKWKYFMNNETVITTFGFVRCAREIERRENVMISVFVYK